MSRGRKILSHAATAVGLWLVFLVIFGGLYGGSAGERVAQRVADSLMAKVTVESTNLAMVRGKLELQNLKVRKDDLGVLEIDIQDVRCDLPPLGLALVDRVCRDLVIDKVRMSVTSASVFQLKKPKKKPLHVERVEINDAELVFSPSAFLPELGKVSVRVDYVEAGPTTFKTPLSWIFTMRELRATLDLPASIVVKLHYKTGKLQASGGVFGSTPIELPFALPVADSADDAKAEIRKLVEFGKHLATELVEKRAEDWLKSKLPF